MILGGEIRDLETADMAVKASLTGHLVFSTLHTNSAIGALARLSDIGIDAWLVEDSLIGVLGQRLVRTNCPHCRRRVVLPPEDAAWLDGDAGTPSAGAGCERCGGTGFRGRTMISELFLPDDAIAAAIRARAGAAELERLARASGMRTLVEDGTRKVRAGVTTRAEVERVVRNHRFDEGERAGL